MLQIISLTKSSISAMVGDVCFESTEQHQQSQRGKATQLVCFSLEDSDLLQREDVEQICMDCEVCMN